MWNIQKVTDYDTLGGYNDQNIDFYKNKDKHSGLI